MSKVFETKCEKCGKEFKGSRAAGALALHMYKVHGEGRNNTEVDSNNDEHWRFLDPKNSEEKRAIDLGFTMISTYPNREPREQILK